MTPESAEGSLKITHKRADILETLARLNPTFWLMQALIGTPQGIYKGPTKEMAAKLEDMYKDYQWKGNYEVLIGGNSLFKQMARLLSPKRKMNVFARLYPGIPSTIAGWGYSKLLRADHYNPFTETAVAYNPEVAIAAHEIGHAQFFDEKESPLLHTFAYGLPIVRSNYEWHASRNAMKHIQGEEERSKANDILSTAFGTYYGSDVFTVAAVGSAALGLASIATPFPLPIAFAPILGALGGRVAASVNRLLGRKGDNVFYQPSKEGNLETI